jgi:hypothetical protein
MIQEEQRALTPPPGQPRENIAAPGSGADDFRFDALAVQEALEILDPGLLSLRSPGVDPNVVVQVSDFGFFQPIRGRSGLIELDLGKFFPAASRKQQENRNKPESGRKPQDKERGRPEPGA